jgi:hypothetical protein
VGLWKTEIAICDFPKRSGPWIPGWARVRNPEKSGFGIRDFPVQRNFDLGNRDHAIPDRTERGGDVARRDCTCISEFGVRRLVVSVNRDIACADFPIGKSPTGTEKRWH